MHVPCYDPMWISCARAWPQEDLPMLWQPFSEGPNVPSQFVATMRDAFKNLPVGHALPQTWKWRPTGIYREFAWESMYMQHCGLTAGGNNGN